MSGTDSPVLTPPAAVSARSRHLPTRPLANRRSAAPRHFVPSAALRSLRGPRCGHPVAPPAPLRPTSRPRHHTAGEGSKHGCRSTPRPTMHLPHPLLPAGCIAGPLRSALASPSCLERRGAAPQGHSGCASEDEELRPPRSLPGPSALRPPLCVARLQPPPPAGHQPGRTSGSGAPVAQAVLSAPLRPARRSATCPIRFLARDPSSSRKTQPHSSPLRFAKTHPSRSARARSPVFADSFPENARGNRTRVPARRALHGIQSSFNPLPPRRVGDATRTSTPSRCPTGFNPLPPRRVGDAAWERRLEPGAPVSIRSHPGGWEMPEGASNPTRRFQFQSAPTPEGGRCHPPRRPQPRDRVSIRSHPGGWEMHEPCATVEGL